MSCALGVVQLKIRRCLMFDGAPLTLMFILNYLANLLPMNVEIKFCLRARYSIKQGKEVQTSNSKDNAKNICFFFVDIDQVYDQFKLSKVLWDVGHSPNN